MRNVSLNPTVRNVLIIVALALVVTLFQTGADTADLAAALLSTGITVVFVMIGARLYRENRLDIYGLGDRMRATLYGCIALIVFLLVALGRVSDLGGGVLLLWIAAFGGSVYGLVLVYRHWREYA